MLVLYCWSGRVIIDGIISRIIKGEANLTLATVAQLYAIMGRRAHIVF